MEVVSTARNSSLGSPVKNKKFDYPPQHMSRHKQIEMLMKDWKVITDHQKQTLPIQDKLINKHGKVPDFIYLYKQHKVKNPYLSKIDLRTK